MPRNYMLDIKFEDNGSFDKFINKLDKLSNGGLITSSARKFIDYTREIVIEGTHVGNPSEDDHAGQMKRSWQLPVYISMGNEIAARITNTAEYGQAENYGHFQPVGLYVPAIDRQLIHHWVPGTYALEASLDQAGINFDSIIRPELLRTWYDPAYDPNDHTVKTIRQTFYERQYEETVDD